MLSSAAPPRHTLSSLVEKGDTKVQLLHGHELNPLVHATKSFLESRGFYVTLVNIFSDYGFPNGMSAISLVDVDSITCLHGDEEQFKAIQASISQASTLVWVAGSTGAATQSDSATMRGILRVVANERINAKFAFVHLDLGCAEQIQRTAELITGKYAELRESTFKEQIDRDSILRDQMLWIERLVPNESFNEQAQVRHDTDDMLQQCPAGSMGPFKAAYSQPGVLSSLHFVEDVDFHQRLDDDWIEFKTEAIGLNTKVSVMVLIHFGYSFTSHD